MTEAQWLASNKPTDMYGHLLLTNHELSDREKEAYVEACRQHAVASIPLRYWNWGAFATWLDGVAPQSVVSFARRAHYLRDIIGNPFRPWLCQRCARGPASLVLSDAGVAFACRGCADKHYRVPLEIRSLAQATYDSRDSDTGHLDPVRLAVLADALEEAGCDSEPLLRHLRGWRRCRACAREGGRHASACVCKSTGGWLPNESPHVRGCWAVDLLTRRP